MVHGQEIEKTRFKTNSRDAKRPRYFDCGSSKDRLDIQEKSRFKKRFSYKIRTKFTKAFKDKVSNPMSQKKRGTRS